MGIIQSNLMALIHCLSIKHFRGIENFSQTFPASKLICLIGRGDSGKSTILEAISYVVSPNWNVIVHDNDFFNCDTCVPIEIEATLTDLPKSLIREDKFGLYIRGIDVTNTISDEITDKTKKALTIRLTVKKDLEPKWVVVNDKHDFPAPISAADRAKLQVFIVSDYVDRHFSWNKGNPLYALLNQDEPDEDNENVIVEAIRQAKEKIDAHKFTQFDGVTEKIKAKAQELGIDISKASTGIDFRDITIKDGKVCLHDEKVPFRLKGKGSKRLISIAIQSAVVDSGGTILIDEVEQGLEPDRAQHLVKTLKTGQSGQVIMTTHSRDVLVELETSNLLLMKKGALKLIGFDKSLQNCLRRNPEAFFAPRVVVCEGPTEMGLCRAINHHRSEKGLPTAAVQGVRLADGGGSLMIDYVIGFKQSELDVCLFCDSDDNGVNKKKQPLRDAGISIVDWEAGDYLELAIAKNLPDQGIQDFLDAAESFKKQEGAGNAHAEVLEQIAQAGQALYNSTFVVDQTKMSDEKMRVVIGLAAKKGQWFKRHDKGQVLGNLIIKYIDQLDAENILKRQFNALSTWIYGSGL